MLAVRRYLRCGVLPRPRRGSPRVWYRSRSRHALVSSTAVMLGVIDLVVGTAFLTSVFFQTTLGYSAAALACRPDRDLRRQPSARPAHHRCRDRRGVRRGLGRRDGRYPRRARRDGLRVPDDRPRGRRCPRCCRPVPVAATAGQLSTVTGAAVAFERGFVAAAVIAAWTRDSSACRLTGSGDSPEPLPTPAGSSCLSRTCSRGPGRSPRRRLRRPVPSRAESRPA